MGLGRETGLRVGLGMELRLVHGCGDLASAWVWGWRRGLCITLGMGLGTWLHTEMELARWSEHGVVPGMGLCVGMGLVRWLGNGVVRWFEHGVVAWDGVAHGDADGA